MISKDEIKTIELKYDELIKSCKPFVDENEIELIRKAFDLIYGVQKETRSYSGELNIIHSLEIAKIASDEIGLGAMSVAGALLHNILQEEDISVEELERKFGKVIAKLVDGYTKLSNIPAERIGLHSDKFRQLYLTLADDIRIILIKLAHRLHDMRIIDKIPEEKQRRSTNEVLYLYISIAHRLGLYQIKSEMEDLYMRFAYSDTYNTIKEKLRATEVKRNLFVREFINPIERELIRQGYDCEIKGRPKSVPSIWEKMKLQNVEFDEVYDLFAIRIIIDSQEHNEKSDCWKIYSIVTNIYTPNPKRLRDWITTPKASGYESLHTTVKGYGDRWVEVQIRTKRMDIIAEKGQAAHWRYKGFDNKEDTDALLNQVRDILENPEQIKFDDTSRIDKKANKIFIFTPDGDLRELPIGSTVLDFAYDIHTRVGDSCNGAKVNNIITPIRHILKNGDKVEIITSKNQKPKQDWIQFVKTSKAKNKIKRALKEQKFREAEVGNEILRRKFRSWKVRFNDVIIDRLIKHYKLSSSIDLYSLIAEEKIDFNEIKHIVQDKKQDKNKPKPITLSTEQDSTGTVKTVETGKQDAFIIDDKLEMVNYKLAKCCNPIEGDDVFGFVTIGKGITIHRTTCPNAKRLLQRYGYRKIKVKWKQSESMIYQATIKVTGKDKLGMLDEITSVISSDLRVNMLSVKVDSAGGIFTGIIGIQVKNLKHLDELLHKLLKVKGVNKANRIDR